MTASKNKKQKNSQRHYNPAIKTDSGNKRLGLWLSVAFLAVITFVLFSPALKNNFTNWDDIDYVTENHYIMSLTPESIGEMFSVFVSNHYHPLTLLSLAIDFKMWGLNPLGYILMNILLHIGNVLLVYFIFRIMFGKGLPALIAALVFAIHPMRVESVVWVSERKDILFAFFYLMALFFYVKFITQNRRKSYYLWALLAAVLSLLSKASAVSLPLVLLAFDYYYERKNFKILFLEKLPFFMLSLAFGLLAIKAQSYTTPNTFHPLVHIFLFTYAPVFYLLKFFIPLWQSPLHEFPSISGFVLPVKYYLTALAIPLVAIVFYKYRTSLRPWLFALLLFILPMIFLLIKFPVGPAYVAERYTYMAYLGAAFLLGYLFRNIDKMRMKNLFYTLLVMWLIFLGIRTNNMVKVWQNNEVLWTTVLAMYPESPVALTNRGISRDSEGNYKGALSDFNTLLKLHPDDAMALYNRGLTFKNMGEFELSLKDFNLSASYDSTRFDVFFQRANVKAIMGNDLSAMTDFNKALSLQPGSAQALTGRAALYLQTNNLQAAINDASQAISTNKMYKEAYNCRAMAFSALGRYKEAIADLNKALEIAPNYTDAFYTMGMVLLESNDLNGACNFFRKAAENGDRDASEMLYLYCQ